MNWDPRTWFKAEAGTIAKHPVYVVTDFEKDIKDEDSKPNPVETSIQRVDLSYNTGVGNKSKSFYPSEYNLHDVAAAYDTDGYLRRAVDKYVDLIWRNGYEFVGDNPQAVKYLKARLEQIALVTGTPTRQLLEDIAHNLVLYSNVFCLKARKESASGGNFRTTFDGKRLAPVAGYFISDTPNMWIARNEYGTVLKYKLQIPSKEPIEYFPSNVVHLYYDKKPGLAFGTPMAHPVLGDIESLRKMEENIELLVFQHSIPFFEYIIGNKDSPQAEDAELDKAAAAIRRKPVHGVFVHSWRHKLEVVGAKSTALDAEPYLEHYKKRIFAGLGMSSVAFGEGDTSNRSTAATMNFGMQDTVKRFQAIIKMFIDEHIIAELLLEGGYEFDAFNDQNKVELFIPEIDIDTKIKKENHYTDLMLKNMVSHSEARREIGREPFTSEDWADSHYELIDIPLSIIKAVDEKFSGHTKGGSTKSLGTSTPATPINPTVVNPTKVLPSSKAIGNKAQPANQYGKSLVKPSIPLASSDMEVTDEISGLANRLLGKLSQHQFESNLNSHFLGTKEDIILMVGERLDMNARTFEPKALNSIVSLTKNMMVEDAGRYIVNSYKAGIYDGSKDLKVVNATNAGDIGHLHDKVQKYVYRLMDDLTKVLTSREGDIFTSLYREVISGIFESIRFRLQFLSRTELMRAYNIGKVRVYIQKGERTVPVAYDSMSCAECKEKKVIEVDNLMNFDSIPPFHPECMCII